MGNGKSKRENMKKYFKSEENTIVNFSGGRTSGFLLYKLLQSYGGNLPDNFKVLFQNTGKEFPETLDFVKQCADSWRVNIIWLEYAKPTHKNERGHWVYPNGMACKVVNYETASRNGEPFEDLISIYSGLPNLKQRWCTTMLKQKVAHHYAMKCLNWEEWQSYIGIRYDEPSRWRARGVNPRLKREMRELPLVDAKITAEDVDHFWSNKAGFNVNLPRGVSNCDLCFLKGNNKKRQLIRKNPRLADWWLKMEEQKGVYFRNDSTYKALKETAIRSPELPIFDNEDIACTSCTD